MLISRETLRYMINCKGTPPTPKITLLLWIELLFDSICVCLSLYRLLLLHCDLDIISCSDPNNPKLALKMFYGLSFTESFFFLIEKAYWKWGIMYVTCDVNDDYGFDKSEIVTFKGFFCHIFTVI